MSNYKEKRPWGEFENLLEESFTKVKKITILPNERPSYQYHDKRSEIWSIVKGSGIATLNENIIEVKAGDVIEVPLGCRHRIENTSDHEELIFIEVQHGTYFGEDDIVRIEDDYDR
ncbi:mannose-6-phosphate isomerase [bacterium]|nr:mannose-6-phosphate isomerase [bacterium]